MNNIVTDDMIMAAMLGLNREIKEWDGFEMTQTNKNFIVTLLTQAMSLREKGYCGDDIRFLLMDNASNMIELALEALYE